MSERNERIRESELETEGQIDIFDLLFDFIRGLKKIWWIIPVLVCLCGGLLYARTVLNYTPMYKSQSSFTVTTASTSGTSYSFYYDNSTAEQMASTFPYILESDLLTDLVKNDLGVEYINGSITASAVAESNLFTLTVTSNNAQDAYDILQAVMNHYSEVSAYVIGDTKLNMIEAPKVAETPYNEKGGMDAAAKGAAVGLIVGIIIVFIYGKMRKTIRKEDEIKDTLNVQCLGLLPKVATKKHRVTVEQDISILNKNVTSGFRESVHSIALKMEQDFSPKGQKVVLVTSTVSGEGVSVVSQNLAYALAEMGKKVLYFDGHLQTTGDRNEKPAKPSKAERALKAEKASKAEKVSKAEKLKTEEKGLEDILRGKCSLKEALKVDGEGRIFLLKCKKGMSAREILTLEPSIKNLLTHLRKAVDYVIIDAPSCDNMSQASLFAENADAIVFVVKQDQEAATRVMDSIEEISSYGATFAGCILTQVEETSLAGYGYGKYGRYYGNYSYRRYGYGGRYGYGYGYGENDKKKKESEKNMDRGLR